MSVPRPDDFPVDGGVQTAQLDVSAHWQSPWCDESPSHRFSLSGATSGTDAHRLESGYLDLHRQPDGSAWFAVGQPLAPRAAECVWKAVLHHAARHNVRLLHSAVFRETGRCETLLPDLGFARAEHVEHWRLDGSPAATTTSAALAQMAASLRTASSQVEIGQVTANREGTQFDVDCGSRRWTVSRAAVCRLIDSTMQQAAAGIGDFVPRAGDLLSLWLWLLPPVRISVAACGDRLLGLLVTSGQNAKGRKASVTVQYLGLRPAYRRQGLGTRLLAELCQNGMLVAASLEAFVMGDNESAQNFYRQVGFVRLRSCRPWYRRLG
ncbi:MAG: GNAT family N-acetyltransferase [Planctomycetaceae bacterium]|nr:GNAT family N-acetyltransferase [Planctomycetaceae bacterium]